MPEPKPDYVAPRLPNEGYMEPIRGGAAGGLYDNPGYTKGSNDHLHSAEGHEYFVLQKGILGIREHLSFMVSN